MKPADRDYANRPLHRDDKYRDRPVARRRSRSRSVSNRKDRRWEELRPKASMRPDENKTERRDQEPAKQEAVPLAQHGPNDSDSQEELNLIRRTPAKHSNFTDAPTASAEQARCDAPKIAQPKTIITSGSKKLVFSKMGYRTMRHLPHTPTERNREAMLDAYPRVD